MIELVGENKTEDKTMNADVVLKQRFHDTYNGKNITVGVFVGYLKNGKIRTGWSRCSIHKGDTFDMNTGISHAFRNCDTPIPLFANQGRQIDFETAYMRFRTRCAKYFKDHSFSTPLIPIKERLKIADSIRKAVSSIVKGSGVIGVTPQTQKRDRFGRFAKANRVEINGQKELVFFKDFPLSLHKQ